MHNPQPNLSLPCPDCNVTGTCLRHGAIPATPCPICGQPMHPVHQAHICKPDLNRVTLEEYFDASRAESLGRCYQYPNGKGWVHRSDCNHHGPHDSSYQPIGTGTADPIDLEKMLPLTGLGGVDPGNTEQRYPNKPCTCGHGAWVHAVAGLKWVKCQVIGCSCPKFVDDPDNTEQKPYTYPLEVTNPDYQPERERRTVGVNSKEDAQGFRDLLAPPSDLGEAEQMNTGGEVSKEKDFVRRQLKAAYLLGFGAHRNGMEYNDSAIDGLDRNIEDLITQTADRRVVEELESLRAILNKTGVGGYRQRVRSFDEPEIVFDALCEADDALSEIDRSLTKLQEKNDGN